MPPYQPSADWQFEVPFLRDEDRPVSLLVMDDGCDTAVEDARTKGELDRHSAGSPSICRPSRAASPVSR